MQTGPALCLLNLSLQIIPAAPHRHEQRPGPASHTPDIILAPFSTVAARRLPCTSSLRLTSLGLFYRLLFQASIPAYFELLF